VERWTAVELCSIPGEDKRFFIRRVVTGSGAVCSLGAGGLFWG